MCRKANVTKSEISILNHIVSFIITKKEELSKENVKYK